MLWLEKLILLFIILFCFSYILYQLSGNIVKTTLKDYDLHSMHSGGATPVISTDVYNAFSERLYKLHGRWETDDDVIDQV